MCWRAAAVCGVCHRKSDPQHNNRIFQTSVAGMMKNTLYFKWRFFKLPLLVWRPKNAHYFKTSFFKLPLLVWRLQKRPAAAFDSILEPNCSMICDIGDQKIDTWRILSWQDLRRMFGESLFIFSKFLLQKRDVLMNLMADEVRRGFAHSCPAGTF